MKESDWLVTEAPEGETRYWMVFQLNLWEDTRLHPVGAPSDIRMHIEDDSVGCCFIYATKEEAEAAAEGIYAVVPFVVVPR
jgi:hypothetical protein